MKHNNSRKDKKIANFPKDSVETTYPTIKGLISFNFKYLDPEQGNKFSELSVEQFSKIIEKLKWYSTENRTHWEAARIGNNNGKVLVIYDDFPLKSDFHHPKHVPAGVKWARFRLEGDQRLIGFMIDKSDIETHNLNPDVFYIVFLDLFHKFYISNK